jgi:cardiolipin synthase A/B
MGFEEGGANSLRPFQKSRKAEVMADHAAEPVITSAPSATAVVGGNRIEVIESGEGRLRAILDLIDGAKESLRFLFYMFNADWAGVLVRDALVAAARRGVDVKLLIDGFGSSAQPRFFAELDESGGSFCVFNPAYGRRYLMRNHQKLAIADGRKAITGGANIDDSYMTDEGPRHWRDLFVSIEGPSVACASDYFDALYRWSTRKDAKLRSLRRLVGHHSQWRGPVQWKFSGPLSMKNSWWRSIGRDVKHSTNLDMIFAYFAPPGAMLRRIGQLGRLGRARIITAAKSDNNSTIAAARHSYSRLLRRHVQMYEYQPAKLHTKFAVVDDVVYVGSANLDYRSLYINLEVMLRVRDAAFATQMRGYFERELAESKWITPELHRRRANPWRRLKWALSHFLVNIMDYTVTRRLNFRAER